MFNVIFEVAHFYLSLMFNVKMVNVGMFDVLSYQHYGGRALY